MDQTTCSHAARSKYLAFPEFVPDRSCVSYFRQVHEARSGVGLGPESIDSILYLGHAGLSLDGKTIFGFNPIVENQSSWQIFAELRRGRAFPGVVADHTELFAKAAERGTASIRVSIAVPVSSFREIETKLDEELRGSKYTYGFPNGDGDCNCLTWIERLGVPLLTGRVDEWMQLNPAHRRVRRFGPCLP